MKWYFTLNDFSDHLFPLVKVAVNSAKQNTTLEPVCIFDGKSNFISDWLQQQKVQVIFHTPFYKENIEGNIVSIKSCYDKINPGIVPEGFIKSAFLRVEIPRFAKEEYVVYTDVDVVFTSDPKFEMYKPKIIGGVTYNDLFFFNTGVMILNVKAMKETYDEFCKFIKFKNFIFYCGDQGAYNKFYYRKWEEIPHECNWMALKDFNPLARVIHFVGIKPGGQLEKLLDGDYNQLNVFKPQFKKIYKNIIEKQSGDIRKCIDIWKKYL